MGDINFEPWKKKRRESHFGNFFFDFDRLDEMIDEMMRDFDGLPSARQMRKPLMYGFSMRIDPNGKPHIEQFGNLRATPERLELADVREPLVDITQSDKEVTLTAEMPGVDKKDIKINAAKGILEISTTSKSNPYYKSLELPAGTDEKSAKASFNNGILEVRVARKPAVKTKGEIKIE